MSEEGRNPRKREHVKAFDTLDPADPSENPSLTEGQKAFQELYKYAKSPHGNAPSPPQPQDPTAPPPDLKIIHGLMKEHGLGALTDKKHSVNHHLFVFLYVRGVPQSLNVEQREEFFEQIQQEGSGARMRLLAITKILSAQDQHIVVRRNRCPDDWEPKYPFTEDSQLSKWSPNNGNTNEVFFLIFNESFVPHQEVQLSRNCYLPAAITAQTYAVMNGTLHSTRPGLNPTPRTIRTDQYIRRAFGPDQLYRRIMHDKGGKAIEVFKNLSALPTKCNAEISATDFSDEIALEHLKKYGAGLVTGFYVDDDFLDRKRFSHSGRVTVDPNKKTRHAMVLVGLRKERATGDVWLLLQNWWKGKQFVEVTLEYFQSSKSTVYFPLQTHTKFKDCFTTTGENFNETDFDDGGDDEEDEDEDTDVEEFASEFSEPDDV